jgi:citrate lyase beta subunit
MVGIAAAAARSWPLILATATRVGPGSTAADAVVVDLEHGVPDHDKHRAREVAAAYLQRADHPGGCGSTTST